MPDGESNEQQRTGSDWRAGEANRARCVSHPVLRRQGPDQVRTNFRQLTALQAIGYQAAELHPHRAAAWSQSAGNRTGDDLPAGGSDPFDQ